MNKTEEGAQEIQGETYRRNTILDEPPPDLPVGVPRLPIAAGDDYSAERYGHGTASVA